MVRIKRCLSNLRQLKLIFAPDASEQRGATVRAMQLTAYDG